MTDERKEGKKKREYKEPTKPKPRAQRGDPREEVVVSSKLGVFERGKGRKGRACTQLPAKFIRKL